MSHDARVPLTFVPAGRGMQLTEIGLAIEAVQREQLAAYGLSPGRLVTVLQQRPMTVILAEEVELALEHSVARHIWVEPVQPVLAAAP